MLPRQGHLFNKNTSRIKWSVFVFTVFPNIIVKIGIIKEIAPKAKKPSLTLRLSALGVDSTGLFSNHFLEYLRILVNLKDYLLEDMPK